MPKCTDETVEFGRVGRRVVQAAFDGGDIVSDGGVLLLRQVDERPGLTRAAALAFGDERRSASVQHSVRDLLAQRIYGLCLGWSDVCDHNVLRRDLVPLHGEQERGHFHAYYNNYCYLPLYVFAGQDMLACVLRPSDRDPASVVGALIKRLLVPLRRAWPKTKIIVRADSGFCRPRVLQRLERWGVSHSIGLQKNSRLQQEVELAELALADQYAARQTKQRMLGEFEYADKTWDKHRRVIARLEHGPQGANPRFIVTDLKGSPRPARPRSPPSCSNSALPSCATRAACGCCRPAHTR